MLKGFKKILQYGAAVCAWGLANFFFFTFEITVGKTLSNLGSSKKIVNWNCTQTHASSCNYSTSEDQRHAVAAWYAPYLGEEGNALRAPSGAPTAQRRQGERGRVSVEQMDGREDGWIMQGPRDCWQDCRTTPPSHDHDLDWAAWHGRVTDAGWTLNIRAIHLLGIIANQISTSFKRTLKGDSGCRVPRLVWLRFGMSHHPAWAVGRWISSPPAKGNSLIAKSKSTKQRYLTNEITL